MQKYSAGTNAIVTQPLTFFLLINVAVHICLKTTMIEN
jgi:hypothetical protein